MNITVNRIAKKATYTIGKLYIDGVYFCDTIEDKDRGLTQNMPLSEIKKRKVYELTAIPTGTYKVTLDVVSNKFGSKPIYKEVCKGKLPRLLNVPGYDGILIHIGNTAAHTAGCILVGLNTLVGKVLNSTTTFRKLYPILKAANDRGESITITIK